MHKMAIKEWINQHLMCPKAEMEGEKTAKEKKKLKKEKKKKRSEEKCPRIVSSEAGQGCCVQAGSKWRRSSARSERASEPERKSGKFTLKASHKCRWKERAPDIPAGLRKTKSGEKATCLKSLKTAGERKKEDEMRPMSHLNIPTLFHCAGSFWRSEI